MNIKKNAASVTGLLVMCGCATVGSDWRHATDSGSAAAYEVFLASHGNSVYAGQAKERIEALRWQEVIAANSIAGFRRYLEVYPQGRYAAAAKDHIDGLEHQQNELEWQQLLGKNEIYEFKAYIARQQQGAHVSEAEDRIEALYWAAAARKNPARAKYDYSIETFDAFRMELGAVEQYINKYPNGRYAAAARAMAEEIEWDFARTADKTEVYEDYLKKYANGRHAEAATVALKTFSAIAVSLPEPIPRQRDGKDGWKYTYAITFTESGGVPFVVEELLLGYLDSAGRQWTTDSLHPTARLIMERGCPATSCTISVPAFGQASYRLTVNGTVNPDLRGGSVYGTVMARDANGHQFVLEYRAKLE